MESVETLVSRIGSAPGVTGAFFAESSGKLLAAQNPPADDETISKAVWMLSQSFVGAEQLGMSVEDINLYCDGERVMIRKIGNRYLYMFIRPTINLLLLDLSVGQDMDDLAAAGAGGVVPAVPPRPGATAPRPTAPLPAPPKPPKPVPAAAPSPPFPIDREVVESAIARVRGTTRVPVPPKPPGTQKIPVVASSVPITAKPEAPPKPREEPRLRPKTELKMPVVREMPKPKAKGVVDPAVVSRVKHELTKIMGPMAAIIFRDVATAAGFDEGTDAERLGEFIKRLAQEIPAGGHRVQFTEKLADLMR